MRIQTTIREITLAAVVSWAGWVSPSTGQVFTPPLVPPETHYRVDAVLDTTEGALAGEASIVVRNVGKRELRAIGFKWIDGAPFRLTLGGTTRECQPASEPIEIVLPDPLQPGEKLQLAIKFSHAIGALDRGWAVQQWFPSLWWGYETHASYDVGIETPADLIVGASARRDTQTGRYRADSIRSFGLYFARGFLVEESLAGPTLVRSIFRPGMRECAELVLRTAADAVSFFRQRFGMYPQPSLTIIPGAPEPMGGYPFATAMVVVHGQEACSEKPRDTHWRWIATHEVGHQYWLEHVMAKEPEQGFGWLMIGLGIWTDREYALERGIDSVHSGLLTAYADAVRHDLNTVIEIPPEELRTLDFDYNTQVTHAKGFGIVSALAAVVGRDTFERIVHRALQEYAGGRLGGGDFRRIAEEESAQDLGWFFVPLLRTSRFSSYSVRETSLAQEGDGRIARVTIVSDGTIMLPVPVEARFTGGERSRLVLDRTREEQTLEFPAPSPLSGVVIDPDHQFPLVVPPPEITQPRLAELVGELPWSGGGRRPLVLYNRAVELQARDDAVWAKLGLTLFDTRRFEESLDAFSRVVPLVAGKDTTWHFAALVWIGMLNDLLGRRDLALESYNQALLVGGNPVMQHSQFGLVLDGQWVRKRLESPFISPFTR